MPILYNKGWMSEYPATLAMASLLSAGIFTLAFLVIFPLVVTALLSRKNENERRLLPYLEDYAPWAKFLIVRR